MRSPIFAALTATALAGMAMLSSGCPVSSSTDSGDASDDVNGVPIVDAAALCQNFTHSGDPCSPPSAIICFRQCVIDGCQCRDDGKGGGVWKCTSDFSCDPDSSPLEDSSAPPDDASSDSDSDADSGSDADSDAASDTDADADSDAASDTDADADSDSDSDAASDSAADAALDADAAAD